MFLAITLIGLELLMSGIPSNTQSGYIRKKRLGEILMDAGVLSDLQLQAALSEQRKWGGKLGRTLVEMGFLDEEAMTLALSQQLHLPQVDLDGFQMTPEILGFLRVDIAERYGVFPVAGDARLKTVTLASSDPTNVEALQELNFYTGMKIQFAVSTGTAIDRAIRRHYYGEGGVSKKTATPVAPESPDMARQVAELTERVADLERLMAGQVKALRGMLELLLDRGVVTREDYVAKVRNRAE